MPRAIGTIVLALTSAALLSGCPSSGSSGGSTAGAVAAPGTSGQGGTGGTSTGGSTTPAGAAVATITSAPANGAARDIELTYDLAHPGGASVDVAVEYSTDGGGAWFPATAGAGGDGVQGLVTAATGTPHRFVWNAQADIRATAQRAVKLRVTPATPAIGLPAATARFEVDGSALAAPVKLSRYPYVQLVVGSAATICWRTTSAAVGAVEYGPTPTLGLLGGGTSGPSTVHQVELVGLTPGSLVYYRVLADGAYLVPGERFRAACDAAQPFRFAMLGDSGTGSVNQLRVAAEIERFDPDMLLHMGDVIYDRGEQSDYPTKFFGPYRDILRRAPMFLAIGNHDILNLPPGGPYLENFVLPANNPNGSERYYSFEYGNARFISLDTAIGFILPGSDQHRWLIDELQKPRPDWLIVYYHMPTHSTGQHGSNVMIKTLACPLFEQAGVDLVLTGHDHHYERSKPTRDYTSGPGGIVYVVSGGGGAGLRSASGSASWSEKVESAFHFVGFEVAGRSIRLDAIRSDGTTIETYTLTK